MDCWKNGDYLLKEDVTISPYDHGYLYGLGFFETFRTYNGKLFLWDQHWERLERALSTFRIRMPYTKEEIREVVTELTKQHEGKDGYFRFNVSAGVHDIGLQPTSYENPTVLMMRKELPPVVRGKEKTACWIRVARNTPEGTGRLKSHHYANNVLARFELPSLAEMEGLMCTAEGVVAEGITSNVFWVKGGELFTPSLDTGILDGITRQWVIDYAEAHDLHVRIGRFLQKEVEEADEVFVTNAVQEIVPIRAVEDHHFPGNDGEMYRTLHAAYVSEIESEDAKANDEAI
ncbi:aminodeoxychorismate lyase [Chryseomicrobium palamuruense]|uniref:Aminodeoxychorismate lyase n=1 Tax=Chryseomicrobium palamuruense TaxID=682973 RepID=A0ABV8UZ28_9BACL